MIRSYLRFAVGLAGLAAALAVSGCSALAEVIGPEPSPTVSLTATLPPTPTPTVAPMVFPTPLPPQLTPTPAYPWLPGEVRVFPGPVHYPGDVITVEVTVHNISGLIDEDSRAALILDDEVLASNADIAYSPLREDALVFRWVWDTSGLSPGRYGLTLVVPTGPDRPEQQLPFVVDLTDPAYRPPQEEGSGWVQRITPCCHFRLLVNSAAARDINQIAALAENAVTDVETRLNVDIEGKPLPITLIDNIWGNGAYASSELVISYVDRNYTPLDVSSTLRHEMVHWAMGPYAADATPSILSEGIAVYAAGGHFKPEPIPERAAALVELGYYIPLADLADDFWTYQHEVAYLEAAALTAYIVDTYRLSAFFRVFSYSATSPDTPSQWLDDAFTAELGVGLDEVELGLQEWLEGYDPGSQVDDLRLTIALYDTIRRYQDLYAPYQESLPPVTQAISAGQAAEFMREPVTDLNIAIEAMLVSAGRALVEGDVARAETLIEVVNAAFDDGNFLRDPLRDYLKMVRQATLVGYEIQHIDLVEADRAEVVAIPVDDWPRLETLRFTRADGRWSLEN